VKFDQTDPAAMSAQIAAARAMEATEQVALWWLSFADEDGFRGVAIVQARRVIGAVEEALRRNINPGGDVQGLRRRKAPLSGPGTAFLMRAKHKRSPRRSRPIRALPSRPYRRVGFSLCICDTKPANGSTE
jgi:hypothetical protein